MKFVLISGKCRGADGQLIPVNTQYEAESLKELYEKHPSLKGKVQKLRAEVKVKGDPKLKKLEAKNKELEAEVAKLKAELEESELAALQKEEDSEAEQPTLEVATPKK